MGSFFKKKSSQQPSRRTVNRQEQQTRATAADLDSRYAFRRNRTLTGSLSSNVVSVNEQSAELQSNRVQKHHLHKHRRHAAAALVVVMVLTAGVVFLLLQSIVNQKVIAATPMAINQQLYSNAVHDYLMKHPTERFRFSINTEKLAAYLQSHDFPEVESVASPVKSSGLMSADFHITFRQPVVRWRTGGTTMYIDDKGNAFERNYFNEPSVEVVDQTGIPATDNKALVSHYFLSFVGKVVGRMKDNGYTVTQVMLPVNTTRQVAVQVSGVAYPIKFSIDRPVGEQAEDAARSIRYCSAKGINPQYIDVRVSGRAFYR